MEQSTIENLASYVKKYPIIYINHFDFKMIDEAIAKIGKDVKYVEFNNAFGIVDFENKSPQLECDLEKFLKLTWENGFTQETFLILKDIEEQLNDSKIIALLKRIAENKIKYSNYNETVFILSETLFIPKNLEHYIGVFDIPLPSQDEIEKIINNFIQEKKIKVKNDIIKDIAPYFKGLNEFQINQILKDDDFDINDKSNTQSLISKEKEQFIKKSGILELLNFPENIDDIGGLDNLKDWLRRKAKIFANPDLGFDLPKGIMIIGITGTGKSLTAQATANLFKIPLVRLDFGRLLGKYVGESEENMRKALKLSEAISPCVLLIDEIEKAFSGVGDNGGHEVTNRLFGQFLTWMQENKKPVFIVATANDISKFPPEFLRKGRFDELFFVDLPNEEERKKIFEILLKKLSENPNVNKLKKEIDFNFLIEPTDGFSGSDLEAVVNNTIERVVTEEDKDNITTEDLLKTIKETKPISKTHKEEIEQIRKIQNKFKKANSEDQVSKKSQELTQQKIASTKQVQETIQPKQALTIKQENYIEAALNDKVLEQLGYEVEYEYHEMVLKKEEKEVSILDIPSTYNYNGKNYKITSIGEKTFEFCKSLKSVTISDSVTSIDKSAFRFCESLQSITIPNSVTSIGESAFRFCKSLKSVTIPNSVNSIGESAFSLCESLKSVTIPNSVTSIGKFAFYGCESLQSITISNSVTKICKNAFLNCSSLIRVDIPDSVTSIGESAFSHCNSLKSVTIPDSVTKIGNFAFYPCKNLTNLMIPSSVISIGYDAFRDIPHIEYYGSATDPDSSFWGHHKWGAKSMN